MWSKSRRLVGCAQPLPQPLWIRLPLVSFRIGASESNSQVHQPTAAPRELPALRPQCARNSREPWALLAPPTLAAALSGRLVSSGRLVVVVAELREEY